MPARTVSRSSAPAAVFSTRSWNGPGTFSAWRSTSAPGDEAGAYCEPAGSSSIRWSDSGARGVRELADGHGADHVIETVGLLAPAVTALAMQGEIAFVGLLARDAGLPMIDPQTLWTKGLTLRAIAVGSRAQFEAMNRAIKATHLKPVIDRLFPFEDAAAAYRYYEEQQPFGKVVIAHTSAR
jgi:NADPH:quinone reductase-like Zn-dependent oxidoreductase